MREQHPLNILQVVHAAWMLPRRTEDPHRLNRILLLLFSRIIGVRTSDRIWRAPDEGIGDD
jgi:hypothetical protein